MAYRKIDVFDTTLRDGEQVPGASLNRDEKVKVAHQLARFGGFYYLRILDRTEKDHLS